VFRSTATQGWIILASVPLVSWVVIGTFHMPYVGTFFLPTASIWGALYVARWKRWFLTTSWLTRSNCAPIPSTIKGMWSQTPGQLFHSRSTTPLARSSQPLVSHHACACVLAFQSYTQLCRL
jgi:hypothetical protein